MRSFAGFKGYVEEFTEPWPRAVKRQYGAQNLTNQPQIVLNKVVLQKGGRSFTILPGTTVQKLSPDDPAEDGKDPKQFTVRIKVMSESDPNDPLMPRHGHGQPSEAAGQEFVVTREVWLWMIQPGQSPGAAMSPGGAPPAA